MEEVIGLYRKILLCLEEESFSINQCFREDLLWLYQEMLESEKKTIRENLQTLITDLEGY